MAFIILLAKQGPTIQNSLFEGTQDDAITMTGSRGDITGVFGGGQFQITSGYLYSVGDILRIYTSSYAPRGYVQCLRRAYASRSDP